jgi:hypothetical protein
VFYQRGTPLPPLLRLAQFSLFFFIFFYRFK